MSFWMFIKAVVRALLNESSQLTRPAHVATNEHRFTDI
jgi:hypothetical protein